MFEYDRSGRTSGRASIELVRKALRQVVRESENIHGPLDKAAGGT
jgi:hypothetical protein